MSDDPNQATITVNNSTELAQALNNATGGETILLAPGDYGDFDLASKAYSSTVTITSADPDNMAVFNTIDFYAVTNVTVDHVFIDYTPDETTVSWSNAFEVTDSSYVTLSNSVLTGGPAIYGSEPDVDPSDLDPSGNVIGLPAGRAIGALRSDHITIVNNEISDFHKGITVANSDFVTISFNDVYDLRTTHLNGGDVNNLLIEGNHFHSSQPWSLGGAGDHGDYIHFWTSSSQDGPTQNITIINNFLQQGDGESLLGIYLEDEPQNIGFENVIIDGNVIHNGDSQGIRIEGADGLTITNNTLLQSSGGMNDAPGINIEPTNVNVILENNITAQINIEVTDLILANIISQNNFFIQGFDPKGENYSGYLFVDALNPMATLADLMVLPDSILNGTNFGASVSQFSVNVGSINVIEAVQGDTVLDQSFSAFQYSSLGNTELTNAVITWDYGDGTTGEGLTSDHVYSIGGTYDVTMTITLNGATLTDTKTIEVQEMVLADISFNENSAANGANSSYDVTWVGNEAYTQGADGTAAQFNDDGSYISIEQDISLAGLENLSYQFDIQITGGDDSEIRPFWSHGSYGIRIQGDTINTYLWTSEGETIVASASATDIRDGNLHTITVVFDSEAGTLSTLLDGTEISYQDQITGTVAETPHKIWIGGDAWGNSFVGNIDNVIILADSNIISDGQSYISVQPVMAEPSAAEAEAIAAAEAAAAEAAAAEAAAAEAAAAEAAAAEAAAAEAAAAEAAAAEAEALAAAEAEALAAAEAEALAAVEAEALAAVEAEALAAVEAEALAAVEAEAIAATEAAAEPTSLTYNTNMIVNIADGAAAEAAGYTAEGRATLGADSLIFDGKGYVSLGQDPELFNLDAFTISFDLAASNDKGENKGSVRLVWSQEHYGIEMNGDDLIFRIFTDTGDVQTLRAEDVGIRDTGEHTIVMSYDSATGIMSGYVDGVQVAEATGLTGSIASSSGSDVTLGGAVRGRQLTGEIDNFTMWNDGDHTPDAVYTDASLTLIEDPAVLDPSITSDPSLSSEPVIISEEPPYDPDDYWDQTSPDSLL